VGRLGVGASRGAAQRGDGVLLDAQELKEGLVLVAVKGFECGVPPHPLFRGDARALEQLDELVAAEEGRPCEATLDAERREDEALLGAQSANLVVELGHLGCQRLGEVGVRGAEQTRDDSQWQPGPPVVADACQPRDVGGAVVPIARRRARGRSQQPDPVVVQQGAPRQLEACRQASDGQDAVVAGSAVNIVPVLR